MREMLGSLVDHIEETFISLRTRYFGAKEP